MNTLTFAVMCLSNIACVVIGARLGQKVSKGEEFKLPSVNPVEAVKVHINKREAKIEQDKIDKIMQNIERYDGTPNGQVDVG